MTDRTILPIPDRVYDGPVYEDAKDPRARFDPIEPLRPPAGAPNVLIVLLDDVGFGASSAFGGPCRTPDRRAARPGRTVVLALPHDRPVRADPAGAADRPQPPRGRDGRHHRGRDRRHPGYTSVRPHSAAPMAEVLQLNGYATAQFGKCHEVPVWQTSPVGPFDAWPTGGGGFEHFYGFLGGETNQYSPALYDGHDRRSSRRDRRRRATTSPRT